MKKETNPSIGQHTRRKPHPRSPIGYNIMYTKQKPRASTSFFYRSLLSLPLFNSVCVVLLSSSL